MKCIICDIGMRHLIADLHRCPKCGLVSSTIPPDLSLYDKSYCVKYQRYERGNLNEHLQGIRYATVSAHVPGGRLLDFGCGSGAFIRHCEGNGFEATGFDTNPYGPYTDVSVILRRYDVVTFWDVLEHLADPMSLLRDLKVDWAFASTPCTDDAPHPLTGWHHYYPGEHVHYFGSNSLHALFTKCGFDVAVVHHGESGVRTLAGRHGILTMGGRRTPNGTD